jgi:cell wall-associated NlpC family hydrolase
VAQSGLLPLDQLPQPDGTGIAFTLKLMQRFVGVPYLWGGRTPFGFDCSGFSQAFWDFMGVSIPRDADQQCQAGLPIEGAPRPGDLLFFGEANVDRPSTRFAGISHVAISLGGDEIIHSNGAAWGVSYNSLNPERPGFRAWLREHLVGARRFSSQAG